MKNIIVTVLIAILAGTQLFSQEMEEKKANDRLDFSVNIQTNHLWRGLIITDKPMVAVFSSYALNESKTFTLGFWGGMSMSNESDGAHYKEINYYVKYANKNLSIALWDLFNTRGVEKPDIWDYSEDTTGHLLDLRTSYFFGDSFPMTLEMDVLLYGKNDSQLDGENREQRYSTYLQVGYPLITKSRVNLDAFFGTGLSLNGDTHLYGNGENSFDIVNVGLRASRKLKFSESFSLPLAATVLWNPSKEYARVQFVVSF